ncbi:lytic transglycosylase domain-containing protein [Ochrobactrum sp. MR28]|nr:lytic transglycosylase domain-containing protein [Ochrobactrum sp. MR28]MBX8816875.1 lytic transglycosylase domain-containing protein [Ochrobactrum sp. MR31]
MRKFALFGQRADQKILALALLCASVATNGLSAYAQEAENVPTPLLRPFAPTAMRNMPAPMMRPDPTTTATIPRTQAPAAMNGSLKTALDALSAKDPRRALAIRNGMSVNDLDRHILTWALALSGSDGLSSSDYVAAASELRGWPGMTTVQRNTERALYRENAPAGTVISYLGNRKPQTTEGMILLGRAYLASGNRNQARQLLAPWWATAKLDTKDETQVLREFSGVLTKDDHQVRFLRMLYDNRLSSAARLAAPANAESLYVAFAAVSKRAPDAAQKLKAVHSSWQSNPAFLYANIQHLRRAERYTEAANLMLKAPRDAKSLVDPDAWWIERRVLSRELLDIGKPQIAYRLAAAHSAESSTMAVDAEFHAGWYALRALNDAATAQKHFTRIAEISSRPMSASRAYYWMGRAAEAGGGGSAKQLYQRASYYGTSFYGQLAAAKLGNNVLSLPYPKPSAEDRSRFDSREPVRAIRRLESIGYGNRAQSLYINMAQELSSVGELALLAVMAERNSNHYLSLRVGKIAAGRGLDVGAMSHPTGAIPANANIKGSGAALAYAIARQESEFNISAVSSAGARGLLQLLPGTAKGVAQRAGLAYSDARLTTDAAYNATLGAHYLGEQIERFNGSYILTFAGYNAGPRRASEWVERYGDPRGQNIDSVVDWIERIPYTETRNYVQRVMENYAVYKSRLYGNANIQQDLISGRRG